MPRARSKGNSRDGDREIANFWTEKINRGLEARREYTRRAEEIASYLGPNHDHLMEAASAKFHDFDGASAVTVPKIAQMRNTLGPRLYHAKPVRTITPRTDDGVAMALAKTLEAYLNYTVREAKFVKQLRRSVDDSMVRGRGYLVQDLDTVRNVVTSFYKSSLDVVFDPDFTEIEDAKWIAFRRIEPLWETKRRVTEKWRIKNLGKRAAADRMTHANHGEDDRSDDRGKSVTSDMVTYWVVLSKMGRGFRGMGMNSRRDDSKDFVRFEIIQDHQFPIAEGDWSVPLYLDKDWPLSYLDLIDPLDKPYPDSMSGQVLGSQQAVDLLSSLRLTGTKNRERFQVFMDSALANKEVTHQFKHGTSADVLEVEVPNGKTITDSIFVPNFGEGSQDTFMERQFHIQQIEATTGITEAMHGGQEPGAKERSATASQLRAEAAGARVADLKQRVEEFTTDASRKEAIIARLIVEAEDMAKIVKHSDIGMFFVNVTVPGGSSVPVRDTRPEEERRADTSGQGPLTLEQISPQASNFFLAPEEALEAAMNLFEDMMATEDPRIMELVAMLMAGDMDPNTGMPDSIQVDIVTAELVWEAT